MVLYNCECCNYKTNIKTHFFRHLKTNKHIINENKLGNGYIIKNDVNKDEPKRAKMSQNGISMSQNEPKRANFRQPDNIENLNCKFCNKIFTTMANKRRHEIHRCKNRVSLIIKKEREEHNKEKEKLYNYIEKLLENQGNTTNIHIDKQLNQDNSTNQTITLNSYGNEDISHITDSMKMNFIKLPYSMVQNMIEHVHFNNKKPENKNIALTNKKDRMIKVFKDNKWKYKDKSETLNELIQINYCRLDDYYEKEANNNLSEIHNKRYKKYQDKFDRRDDELMEQIKNESIMVLLSDNL